MSYPSPRSPGPIVERKPVRPVAPQPAPRKLHPFAQLAEERARVTFTMKAGSVITGTVVAVTGTLVRLVDAQVRHREEPVREVRWVLIDGHAAAFVEEARREG